MNYRRIEDEILKRAIDQEEDRKTRKANGEYFEGHHAWPRHQIKEYSDSNDTDWKELDRLIKRVLLTPREHMLVHVLRAKWEPTRGNTAAAWMMITMTKRVLGAELYKVTSKTYATVRNAYADNCSGENHPMWGKTLSKERRAQMSKIHKGKEVSDETRAKLSAAITGRTLSDEHKANLSTNSVLKGSPPWRNNKANAKSLQLWSKALELWNYLLSRSDKEITKYGFQKQARTDLGLPQKQTQPWVNLWKKLQSGWNPNNDNNYLTWRESYVTDKSYDRPNGTTIS